jgi:hypothetical protein
MPDSKNLQGSPGLFRTSLKTPWFKGKMALRSFSVCVRFETITHLAVEAFGTSPRSEVHNRRELLASEFGQLAGEKGPAWD